MNGAVPLTTEDRAILDLEGPTVVGHTVKVTSVGSGAPTVDELRESVARRLPAVPLLTRRLGGSPGSPEWVTDDHFDVRDHIVGAPAAVPVDDDQLRAEIARLFAEHLDRSRPLWRIDVVGPLADGGAALVWRLHHALADGTAAMHFARAVLWDDEPAPANPSPMTAAGKGHAAADDARRRHHLAGFLEREFALSRDRSPFDGHIGTQREVAFAVLSLPALRQAARTLCQGTVNDAVLATVAGGLRRWVHDVHGHLGSVRVKVPVSLHHEGDDASNRDSYFSVSLPLNEGDPVARLAAVQAATRVRKADHDAEEIDHLLRELSRLSPRLERFAAKVKASPRAFSLNVSNVPGPKAPMAVLGAPVTGVHSLAEIGERHALRISAVSYADQICLGLCADPAVVEDLAALAGALEVEADLLIYAAAG